MKLVAGFDIKAELARAEAGDSSAWEGIARHLLAKQKSAPKARKAKSGRLTWAHIILADGREFLTSHYHCGTDEATLAAHADYAQFRGRMEDSGDNSGEGCMGVKLDPAVKAVRVKAARFVEDQEEVERLRDHCFRQRGARQGWLSRYLAREERAAA